MKDYSKEFADLYPEIVKELENSGNGELGIHYGGFPYSGDIETSKILILSINPGFGDEWKIRRCMPAIDPPKQIKYIAELGDRARFATALCKVLCGGNSDKLKGMAEAYISSPYSTPDDNIYQKTFNSLSQTVWDKHRALSDGLIFDLLNVMKPKVIVCTGVNIYQQAVKLLAKIEDYQVESPTLWEKKGNFRYFIDQPLKNGTRLLGFKHFSRGWSDENFVWAHERFEQSLAKAQF